MSGFVVNGELKIAIFEACQWLAMTGAHSFNYQMILDELQREKGLKHMKISGKWRLSTIERAIRQLASEKELIESKGVNGWFKLVD